MRNDIERSKLPAEKEIREIPAVPHDFLKFMDKLNFEDLN